MKTNSYIKCPEELKEKFLQEGKDIANSIDGMMSQLSTESKYKGFKQHLAVQLQVQSIKNFYAIENHKARYKEELKDLREQLRISNENVETLKRQIK